MRGAQWLIFLVVLGAAVGAGLLVVRQAHEVRQLHVELDAMHRAQDELLADYSRLLLERSTLASYQNVERLAEVELSMRFPDQVERLEP